MGGASPTISTSSSTLGGGGGRATGRAEAWGCSGGCRRTGGERAWLLLLLQVLSNTTTGSSLDASPGGDSAAGDLLSGVTGALTWVAALTSGRQELGAAALGGLPRQALSELVRGGLPCFLFRCRLSSVPQGLPEELLQTLLGGLAEGLLQPFLEGLPEGQLQDFFRAVRLLLVLSEGPPGELLPRTSWGLRVGLLTLSSVAPPLSKGFRVGLLARVSGAVRCGLLQLLSYEQGLLMEPCLFGGLRGGLVSPLSGRLSVGVVLPLFGGLLAGLLTALSLSE